MPETRFKPATALAAIDLGSNSFRLEIGRIRQGRYQRLLCQKEQVSLGTGLDAQGLLSREAADRGIRCLQRFTGELARLRPSHVRVVATQTLREARNRDEFLHRAQAMLGLPVEVISGHEEARLIYAGVSFVHPSRQRRLVIDVGGRSTEMIVGRARVPGALDSFEIGSASLSKEFFPDGRMSADAFEAARREVHDRLGHALGPFSAGCWDEALATSGSASTMSSILKANGISDGTVTPKGMRWLTARCIAARRIEDLELPGLKDKRRAVLPGGLAILHALAEHCGMQSIQAGKGALRQGVIIDLHEQRVSRQQAGEHARRDADSVFRVALA